jgi:predicted polyphosphate/ATP-dependent NAD kinase
MTTDKQMEYEIVVQEKDKLIKTLKDQIAYKDKQLDELIKEYGRLLLERDQYKKSLELL